jgi:hypothetical protein
MREPCRPGERRLQDITDEGHSIMAFGRRTNNDRISAKNTDAAIGLSKNSTWKTTDAKTAKKMYDAQKKAAKAVRKANGGQSK